MDEDKVPQPIEPLTFREQAAIAAMQAAITSNQNGFYVDDSEMKQASECSVEWADALVKAMEAGR